MQKNQSIDTELICLQSTFNVVFCSFLLGYVNFPVF